MSEPILLRVVGIPETQGSKTAFVVKGRAVMREGFSAEAFNRLKDWRTAVAEGAVAVNALVTIVGGEQSAAAGA